jgi:Rod binding domain-containing protein
MSEPISPLTRLTGQAQAVDYNRTAQIEMPDAEPGESIREAKLRKATQDFESLFLYKLLKSMRATVPKSTESKFGMETMRELTDEQLAVYLAREGGIGLGEMLLRSLQQRGLEADEQKNSARSTPAKPDAEVTSLKSEPAGYPLEHHVPIDITVPKSEHPFHNKNTKQDR